MHAPARRVLILYTDAGGGHRATARALAAALGQAGHHVTCHNPYTSTLQPLDLFRRFTGRSVEETYNQAILARGRSGLACWAFYAGAAANVRLLTPLGRRAFRALWQDARPDLVISVMPVINTMMGQSLSLSFGGRVPFVVVMTDWAELAKHVWFPPGDGYTAVVGTAEGAQALARKGHPAARTCVLPNLVTHPDFAAPLPQDRKALRVALGLRPDLPVAVMAFGGVGAARMGDLAARIAQNPPPGQVVFLCGRNRALRADLAGLELPYPHAVVGYTDRMRDYLFAADVLVGKAGPQSVSEAVATGLPMLLLADTVLPQEAAVLRAATQAGWALPCRTEAEMLAGLHRALADPPDSATRHARRRYARAEDLAAELGALMAPVTQAGPGPFGLSQRADSLKPPKNSTSAAPMLATCSVPYRPKPGTPSVPLTRMNAVHSVSTNPSVSAALARPVASPRTDRASISRNTSAEGAATIRKLSSDQMTTASAAMAAAPSARAARVSAAERYSRPVANSNTSAATISVTRVRNVISGCAG